MKRPTQLPTLEGTDKHASRLVTFVIAALVIVAIIYLLSSFAN